MIMIIIIDRGETVIQISLWGIKQVAESWENSAELCIHFSKQWTTSLSRARANTNEQCHVKLAFHRMKLLQSGDRIVLRFQPGKSISFPRNVTKRSCAYLCLRFYEKSPTYVSSYRYSMVAIWSSGQVFARFQRKLSEVYRYCYFITLAITKLQIFMSFYFTLFYIEDAWYAKISKIYSVRICIDIHSLSITLRCKFIYWNEILVNVRLDKLASIVNLLIWLWAPIIRMKNYSEKNHWIPIILNFNHIVSQSYKICDR